MIEQQFIGELAQIVGKENTSTAKADLICYSYDATQQQFLPDVVIHPKSAEEISRILQLANRERVPVFPRGAGS
ncbi:MAG: glycolate oxidase subunit GlcD, partial [Desulfuromonas sp.]